MRLHSYVLAIGITLLVLAVSIGLYPRLDPSFLLNMDSTGDNYRTVSKGIGVLLGPLVMALVILVSFFLPWLSDSKQNSIVGGPLHLFGMVVFVAVIGYLHLLLLLVMLKPATDRWRLTIGGAFLLVAIVGNALGRMPWRSAVGFRTPWTMADEGVWSATHRFGSRIISGTGLLSSLSVLAGGWFAGAIALLMAAIASVVSYSWYCYRRLKARV